MSEIPPPLTENRPPETPRWIIADGLLEVPGAQGTQLRREMDTLGQRCGLRASIARDGGRISALLPHEPREVRAEDPAFADETRRALEDALHVLWEEVGDTSRISSTWRLQEYGTTTVNETVFALTEEGPAIVSRARDITPEDTERLLPRSPLAPWSRLFGRVQGIWRLILAALLLAALGLALWTSPWMDRWIAEELLPVETGPFSDVVIVTQLAEGPFHHLTFQPTSTFPQSVEELRRREEKAPSPEVLAAWRALAARRLFTVDLVDERGRVLERVPLALPLLTENRSAEVRVRRNRDGVTLRLRHE